jgi:two-component system chemotaxis sensor kinase CheA
MNGQRMPGTLSPESLAAIRVVFFQESETHLAQIAAGLDAMRAGAEGPETVDVVHRALHSIKGAAGIFALDALVGFAAAFEAVLAEIRAGRLRPDPDNLRVLTRASNLLAELVEAGREDRAVSPDRTAPLMVELVALAPPAAAPMTLDDLDFEPQPVAFRPLRGA